MSLENLIDCSYSRKIVKLVSYLMGNTIKLILCIEAFNCCYEIFYVIQYSIQGFICHELFN